MRSLGYALRTLVGPWLVLPALGLEVASFLMLGMPWRGEGMWTVEWFAIPLLVIGPLCGGAAAVDAARLSRPGNVHLVVSVPWPSRAYLRGVAWCAGPIIGLHLLVIAAAMVVGEVWQPSVGWSAMLAAALLQCAAVGWFAAIGSAIGRFVNPLVAGLAGGIAGFVLQQVASDALTGEASFRLLNLGAATVSRIGWAYNPGYLAGQAITFLMTFLFFIFLPLRVRSSRNVPTTGAVVAMVLAAAVVMAGPAVLPTNRLVANSEPPSLCYDAGTKVCLYYEHRRLGPLVLPKIEALSQAALDAGYPAFVPSQIMENSRTYRASGVGIRRLDLPTSAYEEGRLPLDDLAASLLMPTHCAQLYAPIPPPEEFTDRYFSLLATWLQLVDRKLEQAPVQPKILTPGEVGVILSDFERCDLDGRG